MRTPALHTPFYVATIAWEAFTMILCFIGAAKAYGRPEGHGGCVSRSEASGNHRSYGKSAAMARGVSQCGG
jgi:hypothetical protein